MKKKEYLFRFKQFSVSHAASSMHVGVDAVLLGAVADIPDSGRLLDVGTGCGVIALIAAQKSSELQIAGIDVDVPSVGEAAENFSRSQWSERLTASVEDFSLMTPEKSGLFDMIISNPPYFDSGADPDASARMRARHQASLSPVTIISHGKTLLKEKGRIAMIYPADFEGEVDSALKQHGLTLSRKWYVCGRVGAAAKRIIIEATNNDSSEVIAPEVFTIEIEISPGVYTSQYMTLCKDFYLKF